MLQKIGLGIIEGYHAKTINIPVCQPENPVWFWFHSIAVDMLRLYGIVGSCNGIGPKIQSVLSKALGLSSSWPSWALPFSPSRGVAGVWSLSDPDSSPWGHFRELMVSICTVQGGAANAFLVNIGVSLRRMSPECVRFLPRVAGLGLTEPLGGDGSCLFSQHSIVDRMGSLLLLLLILHIVLILPRPLDTTSTLSAANCE
jgi:hypothetical protein